MVTKHTKTEGRNSAFTEENSKEQRSIPKEFKANKERDFTAEDAKYAEQKRGF